MTHDEAVEVAEKVWGKKDALNWAKRGYDLDQEVYGIMHASRSNPHKWLISEVNSWEGFGRTVEAMWEKHQWQLDVVWDEDTEQDQFGFVRPKLDGDDDDLDFNRCWWKPYDPKTLIEATHKAALKAAKGV